MRSKNWTIPEPKPINETGIEKARVHLPVADKHWLHNAICTWWMFTLADGSDGGASCALAGSAYIAQSNAIDAATLVIRCLDRTWITASSCTRRSARARHHHGFRPPLAH
jgi:hypothetical protein